MKSSRALRWVIAGIGLVIGGLYGAYWWSGRARTWATSNSPDDRYRCVVTYQPPKGLMMSPHLLFARIRRQDTGRLLPGEYEINNDSAGFGEVAIEWYGDRVVISEFDYEHAPHPMLLGEIQADGVVAWTGLATETCAGSPDRRYVCLVYTPIARGMEDRDAYEVRILDQQDRLSNTTPAKLPKPPTTWHDDVRIGWTGDGFAVRARANERVGEDASWTIRPTGPVFVLMGSIVGNRVKWECLDRQQSQPASTVESRPAT
jgi:hypothetical protein